MKEIDKLIQTAKNELQSIKHDISQKLIELKVREAERRLMESFIDQLNDLKNKTE